MSPHGRHAAAQTRQGAGDYKGAMVALVALIPVLLLGALMYGTFEDLKFLDALYFAVVTAATVGFGDYVPTSAQGKVSLLRRAENEA